MYFRMMPFFSDIHISQGSVATCLRRGEIFKHQFVANLLLCPQVKIFFENQIIVGEVMAKSLVSYFFDSRCSARHCCRLTGVLCRGGGGAV